MKKFKMIVYEPREIEFEIGDREILSEYLKTNYHDKNIKISDVEYIDQSGLPNREWYCHWWNGYSWKSKVVKAPTEEFVEYNIRNKLDYDTYDFACVPNEDKYIEGLFRSIWD